MARGELRVCSLRRAFPSRIAEGLPSAPLRAKSGSGTRAVGLHASQSGRPARAIAGAGTRSAREVQNFHRAPRGLSKLAKPPDLKSIAQARSRPQDCPQWPGFESVSRSSRKPLHVVKACRGFESLPLRSLAGNACKRREFQSEDQRSMRPIRLAEERRSAPNLVPVAQRADRTPIAQDVEGWKAPRHIRLGPTPLSRKAKAQPAADGLRCKRDLRFTYENRSSMRGAAAAWLRSAV